MSTFLAGPDGLEVGWLVSTWIPAVRKKSRSYDRTVIVGRSGFQYLYEFADEYIQYDLKGKPDRWLLNGKKTHIPKTLVNRVNPDKIWKPNRKICYEKSREYIQYGDPFPYYHILIHARAMTKYGQEKLNYPVSGYEKLVVCFKDCYIGSIGSKKGAHHIAGTDDLRGIPIENLCNMMAGCRVVVGTSSGPMHLASNCGAPIVVLTGPEKLKSMGWRSNSYRYKKAWKPFEWSKVTVLERDGWKPHLHDVIEAIGEYL